jgi:hypothetical protein
MASITDVQIFLANPGFVSPISTYSAASLYSAIPLRKTNSKTQCLSCAELTLDQTEIAKFIASASIDPALALKNYKFNDVAPAETTPDIPILIDPPVGPVGPVLSVPLSIWLPMDSSGADPVDISGHGFTPTPKVGAVMQSGIVLPGKSWAGYSPSQSIMLGSRWEFGNYLGCSINGTNFIIDVQVYLPASGINPDLDGTPVPNIIYGGGAPDSGAPRFGVFYNSDTGLRELAMQSSQNIAWAAEAFPLDAWVHVRAEYDLLSQTIKLYQNNVLKAQYSGYTYLENGEGAITYNLGSAEYNGPYSFSWGGYISQFKLYLPT